MGKLSLIMSTNCMLLFIIFVSFVCTDQELLQRHPDVGLNAKQLIEKYGYPFENHTVQTADGYLLEIHRISHGRHNAHLENKPVVLLAHGLLCSSMVWVNMGPEKSLGFILADQGYDVWMANYRGTTWSRKHIKLNPDKNRKDFWSYSFHEIGIYDIKAFIDYILYNANQKNLFYVGHSLGAATLLVFLSEQPDYNKKIRLATLVGPVVYVENMKTPAVRLLAAYKDEVEEFVEKNQVYEVLPHTPMITLLGQRYCNDYSPFQNTCASVIYSINGFSPKQMNKTMIPVILSNTPAGASMKQLQHVAQFVFSKNFQQYDYGKSENLIKYGQPTPPEYSLSKVTSPLLIYYGSRDLLCVRKDIDHLAKQLPNVILKRRIKGFSHIDYLWGIDADKVLYSEILEIMKRYE